MPYNPWSTGIRTPNYELSWWGWAIISTSDYLLHISSRLTATSNGTNFQINVSRKNMEEINS